MGLTIDIGEYLGRGNGVLKEKHENAPADGVPTDYTNARWPTYRAWRSSMVYLGLDDLMYGDKGLMAVRYSCRIRKRHIIAFKKAYDDFYKAYPQYKKENIWGDPLQLKPEIQYHIDCLEWLNYWLNWAYENCSKPTFCAF